jgi:Domain of unknown function (DUF4861)
MKNTSHFLLLSLLLLVLSCSQDKTVTIQLTNPADITLVDKAISITREEIPGVPETQSFPVLLTEKGDTIPSQLDDLDGDAQWDELFFVTNLRPKGTAAIKLSWTNTQLVFPMRTSIRFGKRDAIDQRVHPKTSDTLYANQIPGKIGYEPYQTDGPSWENDKVGFRHYFDGRNAMDLFGKKLPIMSPDSVGISPEGAVVDNYHVMADWGRDIMAVGNSVGLGGINLMIGDTVSRIGNIAGDSVTNFESAVFNIVKEGPVRSIFDLRYNNWKPFDRTYQVDQRVSIWPGMYAYHNTVKFSGLHGDETLLVGLVNSNTRNPLKEITVDDRYVVLYTHDQQTYDRVWWLGLAIILPKDIYLGYDETPQTGLFSNSFYGKLKIEENKPVSYYAVGCWELSDEGFRDPTYFENYVTNLAQQLSADVKVEIQ